MGCSEYCKENCSFKDTRAFCCELGVVGKEAAALCRNHDCRGCMKGCCSAKTARRWLPIIGWIPKYRLPQLQGDLVAGFTVGLTVIPQGLAYATVAGLPPQYGLYSAFLGCLVYCFLGTSKDITLGPTAIMSLLTAQFAQSAIHDDATVAVVLCLFAGIIQFTMGILRLGFLVDYIPHPVIHSFTNAAAITIAVGQIKTWLGLKHIPQHFMEQVEETFHKLPETHLYDFSMGLVCMVLLYVMKKMKKITWSESPPPSMGMKVWKQVVWLVATARNAIIVVLAAVVCGVMEGYGHEPFTLAGNITGGLPEFQVPAFSASDGNVTMSTEDVFGAIGIGFFIVPLLGLVETVAIGNCFARANNYKIDATQELIAMGTANVLGSFVGSYPVTGSFSRTAVNSQSGVMTPAGGVWTAALVLLALGVLTPLFRFIPKAGLAGVIIMAVIDMISFKLVTKMMRLRRVEIFPWLACFICSFILGIEFGILVGIGCAMLLLLFPWGRPKLEVSEHRGVMVLTVSSGLLYPGAEYFCQQITKKALRGEKPCSVAVNMSSISTTDITSLEAVETLVKDFTRKDLQIVMFDFESDVKRLFQVDQLAELIVVNTVDQAVDALNDVELGNAKCETEANGIEMHPTASSSALLDEDDQEFNGVPPTSFQNNNVNTNL